MTLAIDGHVNWGGSGVSSYGSPNFSTVGTNRVVVICCQGENAFGAAPTISSITDNSGQGNTWAKYTTITDTSSGFGTNCPARGEIWWTVLPTAATNITITAHWSVAMDGTSFTAFGVSGVQNLTAPFDANGSLPGLQHNAVNSGATPRVASLNTTDSNALVFGFFLTFRNNLPSTDTGNGWSNIDGYTNSGNGISLWSMNRVDMKITPGSNFTADMVGSEVGFQFIVAAITSQSGSISGTWATTEAKDAMSFAGYPRPTATMATTEAKDIMAFANPPDGSFAITEAKDAMAFAGHPVPTGQLAVTGQKDSMVACGWRLGHPITGRLKAKERFDRLGFSDYSSHTGTMASRESPDRLGGYGILIPEGACPPAAPANRRKLMIVN